MFSIDYKAHWLIGGTRPHSSVCLSVCLSVSGQHTDDVVIITRLPISAGTFLFSKIMNCIDDGSWNTGSHQLSSSFEFLWTEEPSGLLIRAFAVV